MFSLSSSSLILLQKEFQRLYQKVGQVGKVARVRRTDRLSRINFVTGNHAGFLPEIAEQSRAAIAVFFVMCFEDALSDENMMKLDWNYLGWARFG